MIHIFDGEHGRILVIPDHTEAQTNCGGTDEQSDLATVWTPSTTPGAPGSFNQVSLCRTSLFCAGHSQLADGRVLVIGGSQNQFPGLDHANLFDPSATAWNPVTAPASMNFQRWYPTATTLPDGRCWLRRATTGRAI